MKYTKEERLEIGRRIYDGEISRYEAAFAYDISEDTARQYMRMYRASKQLPPRNMQRSLAPISEELAEGLSDMDEDLREAVKTYDHMTREELILELLKTR